MSSDERLFLAPATVPVCEWHDKGPAGLLLASVLVETMRARHGKGGTNICRDCIVRIHDAVRRGLP